MRRAQEPKHNLGVLADRLPIQKGQETDKVVASNGADETIHCRIREVMVQLGSTLLRGHRHVVP